jgi:two-component system sensor histidine kinase DctS
VPWWFAEKYKLNVVDDTGRVLASKSNVETGQATLQYQVPFDPPGHGLALQVVAYRSGTRLLPALLMSSVAGLGLATLWSLWALRRHVQRRYAAENALREEHAFRQAMENSLHTGMRARDLEGRILYVNRAFCQMTGFARDEIVGHLPPMPYWPPEEVERIDAARNSVLEGRAPSAGYELRYMHKDGARIDVLIHEAPLIDGEGRQIGWMGSVVDITERKRAEELARQQQEKLQFTARLVTMGEMASTLAHELNQPLAAISSYSTGALNRLEADHLPVAELREALVKLQSQARRAGEIIRRVHDFVRRSEPRRETLLLRPLLEDAIGLMEPLARRHGVRIALELQEPLPTLSVDRLMIEQVLVNLLRNGIDAMRDTPPAQRDLRVRAELHDDGLAISVADRGPGIEPTLADKLYAPFFTTKPDGMGMGLNICRSIAELHGGRISHQANPRGGTIFVLQLPLEKAEVQA